MENWTLLPPDLIELQLGQIDLLLAVYPDEAVVNEQASGLIDDLRKTEDSGSQKVIDALPSVPVLINLPIALPSKEEVLELDLAIPFFYESEAPPEDPPHVKIRVRQPSWLNRAATIQLTNDVPDISDLLGTIEHIKEVAIKQFVEGESTKTTPAPQINAEYLTGPTVRVWFYFPSISTRSKRDDFIIYAPSYNLTGFLYAGKPGLLCVEGTSKAIDDYMKFIKTESWGDIPAHHKKVSERYRETGVKSAGVERVFADMTEITDTVGERRGQRANRGDMQAVEEWLVERGLGDAFTKVFM